jgi:hypothetical protein
LYSENLKARDNLEILVVEEILILKVTLRKWGGRMWASFICLKAGIKSSLMYTG